jgi:transposase
MERVNPRSCGLDVHKASVTACIRVAQGEQVVQEVRTFATDGAGLIALRDWLESQRIDQVAMEATGVYWKPVYYALEDCAQVMLVNAAHVKQVPGRKTDVADSAWLAQLLEHGLLRASFIPPQPIRDLRDLTRYRKSLQEEHSRVANRLEKVLQDAGIKLSSVASDILGVTGRQILAALAGGRSSPEVLAELARGRLRQKKQELREALRGRFREHHAFFIGRLLVDLDNLEESMTEVVARIEELLRPFAAELELVCSIPGVKETVGPVLLAEIGVNMQCFATPGHLASWARLCPPHNESAGKRRRGKWSGHNRWLRTALIQAANAASRKRNCALAALYHRIRARSGHNHAIFVLARHILELAWLVLSRRTGYHELGATYFESRRREQAKRRSLNQLKRLGYNVTLTPIPQAA